jgi:putative cardiolipin synthase
MNAITKLTSLMALAILASCATVPSDYPREPSFALEDTGATELGRRVSELTRTRGVDQSGFYVLTEGVDALAARLILADRAERSIDAQYYIVEDDLVGTLFIDRLLAAADRGVRVRLLIDDQYTLGDDPAIAAIDSHPNLEIRVFNPFSHRSSARLFEYVTDLDRVDHRMHSKSFTVDNQVSILGGRNIADDYFDANREFEFGDLDVAGVGPVAKGVSTAFDIYWNSDVVLPAAALIDGATDPDALPKLRKRHAQTIEDSANATYLTGLESSIVDNMLEPGFPLFWGTATVVYDDPAKAKKPDEITTVRSLLSPEVQAAESELMVVSPYFVLLDAGQESFRKLRDRGVRIVVLTNSLASTDMVPAHSGYAACRKNLLEWGVEMHEVKPDVSFDEKKKSGFDFTHSALHMKSFIVDRRYIFVGSFNWDPRSARINTEIGAFVDSPAFAEWAAELLESRLPTHSYRARLDAEGEIEWVDLSEGDEIVYSQEPMTGAWRRFRARFFGILPIEDKL